MTLAQIQPRDAVQVKPCASRAGFLFLLPMTAIFKPDITGQMSEITMSEDLHATLAQLTFSRPLSRPRAGLPIYVAAAQRAPFASGRRSKQRRESASSRRDRARKSVSGADSLVL